MTKLELEKLVEKQAKELEKLGELEALKKRNAELVTETFNRKKQLDAYEIKEIDHNKKMGELSKRYNELAQLFDEHIKGMDDILEINKLFLRNALRTQELINIKIKAYNGLEGE
jgi:hypothetical protein